MKILYLSEWYPHRYDAMAGLFVRKHAEAVVRQGVEVEVLYLHRDERVADYEIEEQTTNGVREIYVYYRRNYLGALKRGYKYASQPDVCQLNVLTKNAILPLFLKIFKRIPYIVVEHWGGYLPQSGKYVGFFHKRLAELAVYGASAVCPVSEAVACAMKSHGLNHCNYVKINNVVDDFFYEETVAEPRSIKRIVHISCFDERTKNVSGILHATKMLTALRIDFELVLVGTGPDFEQTRQLCAQLQLDDFVKFVGEQPPRQVKYWLDNSDFSLLFSNIENAPVVISESLACGKPVVATRVGGIPEMINASTGVMVESRNVDQLCETLYWMLDNFLTFEPYAVRQTAAKYTEQAVGKQLVGLYEAAKAGR